MARVGVCSRRRAEAWIREGRVTVNGELASDPAISVDPDADRIRVDGRPLRGAPPPLYLLLNKPRGVVTSLRDPQGRTTVAQLLKGVKVRVFPVGRLDFDTEGLLLLTNDGDLAQRLLHPRYGLPRTYLAKVKGIPSADALESIRRGIRIEPGMRVRAQVRLRRLLQANAWLEMTLHEGRHREVRRICESVGHPVLLLRRIRFGPLTLQGLPGGRFRPLHEWEVLTLRRLASEAGRSAERPTGPPSPEASRRPRVLSPSCRPRRPGRAREPQGTARARRSGA
jgi:23S rRNA pseudouridine2605 synthase